MVQLPFTLAVALAAMGLLAPIRDNTPLLLSFLVAAATLASWHGSLRANARRHGRTLRVRVNLRPQHYVQACAQVVVLLYWGYFWREVYHSMYLIAAQLVFAYAFDMLLTWSRRDIYCLGFGPVPVILSASLFLWFRAEWFVLQFLLVAVAFAAKELIRWDKGGRRVHIFNPSAFPLALFSLALIVTGTTDLTWGQEIATTLNNAPHIYLLIFLVALPGQVLFGVATMTMSAVVTMYGFGLLYVGLTGTYFFVDSYIPIAVFLGMHLLFTDPSTSPRTELGRILFGALYALSVVGLYAVLEMFGAPTFYDKLLAVPVMNLAIKGIDRIVREARSPLRRWERLLPTQVLIGRQRQLALVGVWTVVFVAMSSAQAIGDTHRGEWVTFWLAACEDDRPDGCRHAARLTSAYCGAGSGWACNEYGVLLQPVRRPERAGRAFRRACDLGFPAGCDNLDPARALNPHRAPPSADDLRIVLRTPSRLADRSPRELGRLACAEGFLESC